MRYLKLIDVSNIIFTFLCLCLFGTTIEEEKKNPGEIERACL